MKSVCTLPGTTAVLGLLTRLTKVLLAALLAMEQEQFASVHDACGEKWAGRGTPGDASTSVLMPCTSY